MTGPWSRRRGRPHRGPDGPAATAVAREAHEVAEPGGGSPTAACRRRWAPGRSWPGRRGGRAASRRDWPRRSARRGCVVPAGASAGDYRRSAWTRWGCRTGPAGTRPGSACGRRCESERRAWPCGGPRWRPTWGRPPRRPASDRGTAAGRAPGSSRARGGQRGRGP